MHLYLVPVRPKVFRNVEAVIYLGCDPALETIDVILQVGVRGLTEGWKLDLVLVETIEEELGFFAEGVHGLLDVEVPLVHEDSDRVHERVTVGSLLFVVRADVL